MGKNVIVSEETLVDLLEAHASLSAWYYELSAALRQARGVVRTPDDATRASFVPRLAQDFPELAAVARTIRVPRTFVPPPPAYSQMAPGEPGRREAAPTLLEPAVHREKTHDSEPDLPRSSVPPDAPPVK